MHIGVLWFFHFSVVKLIKRSKSSMAKLLLKALMSCILLWVL